MAAIVARPVVLDTAIGTEPGFLGDELHAASTRTIRPAQFAVASARDTETRGADSSSSSICLGAPSSHPVVRNRARSSWRSHDAIVKL